MWAAIYAALVLALFVRVQDATAAARPAPVPGHGEPLRLLGVHHALFYALLLVVSPLEATARGGGGQGRAAGALLFVAGVGLYRWGAAALGPALSPLVTPVAHGQLVTRGPYRLVRHPMYLGQLCIAFGAPLTLGCRWALAVSLAAAIVLVVRIRMEEDVLSQTYADYGTYRARSKRLVPFVF